MGSVSRFFHSISRFNHLRIISTPREFPPRKTPWIEDETVLVDELVRVELVGQNQLRRIVVSRSFSTFDREERVAEREMGED